MYSCWRAFVPRSRKLYGVMEMGNGQATTDDATYNRSQQIFFASLPVNKNDE